MGEPFFPPPGARGPDPGGYREPAPAPPEPKAVATTPAVVVRPDPPAADEDDAARRAPPKLSKDEIRALLATEGARRSTLARCGKRTVVVVPIGILHTLSSVAFSSWPIVSTLVTVALGAAGLAYIAAPLWQQERDGWV